jgi:hypothetical protein
MAFLAGAELNDSPGVAVIVINIASNLHGNLAFLWLRIWGTLCFQRGFSPVDRE